MENLASLSKRSFAFILDDILISLLFIIIFYEQISSFGNLEGAIMFIQSNIIYLLLLKIIYHTFFVGLNGMTPGKYLLKIKVVDENNFELIGYNRAFVRAIVRTFGELIFYITFIPAFFTPRRQTLHDKLAKSVVINV